MDVIDELREATARIATAIGDSSASDAAVRADDDTLLKVLRAVGAARHALDLVGAAFSSEVDRRSQRAAGYSGLAQRTGHRTATSLIQTLTGQSATEVRRTTDLGKDLTDAAPTPSGASRPAVDEPWFAPLTRAAAAGRLSGAQFAAIREGLGAPPERDDLDSGTAAALWRGAGVQLLDEIGGKTVEDLRVAARLARDTLDPVGCQLRFDERFRRRSFTMWIDEHGQHTARIRFDDETAAWIRTIRNAALRPRRGPRFVPAGRVDAHDAPHEDEDSRSLEQLQYDTVVAILRTGANADPAQTFGDRQPGVRIVTTLADVERDTPTRSVGHFEEDRADHSRRCGREVPLRRGCAHRDRRWIRQTVGRRARPTTVHAAATCGDQHPRWGMPVVRRRTIALRGPPHRPLASR